MAFPEKYLNDGENVVLDLRPHWWTMVPAGAMLFGSLIVALLTLVYTDTEALRWLAGLLVLVAVGWFIKAYISWISENFTVTNERVIYRSGVVSKTGIEIPLDRINAVFFKQSLFERLVGAGDVSIESAAESGRQNFSNIRRPNAVQQEIYRQMEANEHRGYERHAQATARAMGVTDAPPSSTPSIPDQIAKLDELRRQGALSDEEFEAKKRDLLDRM